MSNDQNGTSKTIQLIQVVVRSIIAIAIVGVGSYALVTGRPIPSEAWQLGAIILGALFSVEALAKYKTLGK